MAHQKSGSHGSGQESSADYRVLLTRTAEVAYENYFEKAKKAIERGDITSAHCTTLRQIDDALENIIPHNPVDPRFALVGDLKQIYRLKKGRLRICWIASSDKRLVFVLFISETLRKAGDPNDPYKILQKMVQNGTFDDFFNGLGIKPPTIMAPYQIQ